MEEPPWSPTGDEGLSYEEGKQRAVERFQRLYIERALTRAGGNITRAAEAVGLTRAAFQRIMRSLNLDPRILYSGDSEKNSMQGYDSDDKNGSCGFRR